MTSVFPKASGALAILAATLLASTAAAQTAPPISAYGELPDFEDADLSPEGDLALLANVKGNRLLLILDEKMKATNSMAVGDMKVRNIEWAGNDRILLTRTDTQEMGDRYINEKGEFTNVMLLSPKAGEAVETIFSNERKMLNSTMGNFGRRLIKGRWVGFYGGVEMARNQAGTYYVDDWNRALYAVDLLTNKFEKVANPATGGGRVSTDWLIGADGKIAARLEWRQDSGKWKIENADGKAIASGKQERGRVGLGTYGRDGTTALFYDADENNDMKAFEVKLNGSEAAKPFMADIDIGSIYTDSISGHMIGYRIDEDRAMPTFFDPEKQGVVEKIARAFSGRDVYLRDWTPDFQRVLVTTKGNRDSGTWYLVDMDTMTASPIGKERPRITPAMVGPISTFEYTAADGLELDGILTLPSGREAKNLPVIMFPHGGPHSHDTESFDWWAQALASRGYAVFQPNFRGSTNKDFAFEKAGYGQWGKLMQTDISDGMAALAAKGIVDPKRACIMGASYGGYAALAGVTIQNGLYQCSVAVAAVSDIAKLFAEEKVGSGKFGKASLQEEFGPVDQHRNISPRYNAEKADAPILMIHGRDDTVVLYNQSTVMADALKSAGKPYELVDLGGEDHWLSKSETRNKMLAETVAFIEKHNPAD